MTTELDQLAALMVQIVQCQEERQQRDEEYRREHERCQQRDNEYRRGQECRQEERQQRDEECHREQERLQEERQQRDKSYIPILEKRLLSSHLAMEFPANTC